VAVGAALIEPSPSAAFAIGAVVLLVAALPTLVLTRRAGLGRAEHAAPTAGARASFGAVLRRPGARDVLIAQTLWVFAYAALPTFFVLYADETLGLDVGVAGALPLAFGAFLAAGLAIGGRTPAERVYDRLMTGAALLGAGLIVASTTTSVAVAALPLAAAGLGAGMLTTLGFPYFTRFVPKGEEGSYSGAFFAGRGIASAAALPLAGVAVEISGTYRTVLWLGAAAFLAALPLMRAERRRTTAAHELPAAPAAPVMSIGAVIPVFDSPRAAEVARATLQHVDRVVLVDDGAPYAIARDIAPLADDPRVDVVTLGHNGGKGGAVAAGMSALLGDDATAPDAVIVVDSDGQHDPDRIPAFVEAAAHADVVIGDRRDRHGMPLVRRIGNRVASAVLFASTRRWIPDTQNGMRLFTTRALRATPVPPGGYDAEARHLRSLIKADNRIASVEIPTIYEGEPSHFRPVADTIAVGRALFAPARDAEAGRTAPATAPALAASTALDSDDSARAAARAELRHWPARIAAAIAAAVAIGFALPLLQPADNQLFLAINGIGDGPNWLYDALDPHARNYGILVTLTFVASAIAYRRLRYVIGAVFTVVLAGYAAGAALNFVKLFVERARPEEVLTDQVLLSHGRTWSEIASYPSGHLIVTAALVTAAAAIVPQLRTVLYTYLAAIAVTRITFGAHFPLDVFVGAVLGREFGLLSVTLAANARLLPATTAVRARRRRAAAASATARI
jgi:membrane-associated phospholipid phosphatase